MKNRSFFLHLLVANLLINSASCFADISRNKSEKEIVAQQNFEIASERFKEFCDHCKNGNKKAVVSFLNQYIYSESNTKIKFDINGKDTQGNSPLSLAEKAGHKEIIELLKEAGAV